MSEHGLPNKCAEPGEHGQFLVNKYMFGVVIDPMLGDTRYVGWLSIPYITTKGIKAIRFRNLTDNGDAKYGQAKGQPTRLYNPAALFGTHQEIGIAEGEIDAVASTEGLSLPTVGVPGATQWIAHHRMWAPLFKDFERVFVLRDGDEAGKDLADAIVESLKMKVRVIRMPANEDVSTMLVQGRASELTKQMKDDE